MSKSDKTGRMTVNLKGRVALVTGGRRGLGRAMVLGLAEAGAKVAIVARSAELGTLPADLEALGSELLFLQADLTHASERKNLVQRVVDQFGRLDILVNNAGAQMLKPFLEFPLDEWEMEIAVMLTAAFDLSQQAARAMIEVGGGKIVNIASVASYQATRNNIPYVVAKHGLVGLTRGCCAELARYNINVNAIAPGIIKSDMTEHIFEQPGRAQEILGRIPAGRFGDADDLVGTLLFLCSDASRHIHGHVIAVDGGALAR